MGALLSAGICSRVRSVSMLVSSLLVMDMQRRGRRTWRLAIARLGEFDMTRHGRAS